MNIQGFGARPFLSDYTHCSALHGYTIGSFTTQVLSYIYNWLYTQITFSHRPLICGVGGYRSMGKLWFCGSPTSKYLDAWNPNLFFGDRRWRVGQVKLTEECLIIYECTNFTSLVLSDSCGESLVFYFCGGLFQLRKCFSLWKSLTSHLLCLMEASWNFTLWTVTFSGLSLTEGGPTQSFFCMKNMFLLCSMLIRVLKVTNWVPVPGTRNRLTVLLRTVGSNNMYH